MLRLSSLLLISAAALIPPQPTSRLDNFGDPLPERAIARMGTLRFRHGDRVHGVCFSHDEKSLFSAGEDKAVRQWDVATGKLLRELKGHDLCFWDLAISPDGKTLAAAGGSADSRVYLWDAHTGNELNVIRGESDIHALAFSPDSKTLAWVTLENRLVLWDIATETKKGILLSKEVHEVTYCVDFSPDGKQLAIGSNFRTIYFVDFDSLKVVLQWNQFGVDPPPECVRYSHNGKMLATGGGLYAPIRLWSAKTRKLLHTLSVDLQLDRAIAFSPDDRTLVSQNGNEIILWEVVSGKKRGVIRLPTRDYAQDFAFTRNGKTLAIAHDGHAISVVDLEKQKLLFPLEAAHRSAIGAPVLLERTGIIVSASTDGTICTWEVNSGKQKSVFSCGDTSPQCLVVKADERTILWGGHDGKVHLLDTVSGKETQALTGHEAPVTSLALTPDENRLVSMAPNSIKIWDLRTGKCIATRDNELSRAALAVLPDGKRFITTWNDELHIYDLETLKPIAKFDGQVAHLQSLSLSADGKRLAVSTHFNQDRVLILDVESRQRIAAIDVPGGTGAVRLSPDGKRVAFTSNFEPALTIWDIEAKKAVRTLNGHWGHVYSLTFSSDGRRLISTGGDTTMVVWNVAD